MFTQLSLVPGVALSGRLGDIERPSGRQPIGGAAG
jgi:hypothetical protein